MQGEIRINIEYLAKSYGFKEPVQAHILVDWVNHGSDLLVLTPVSAVEPQVARDLAALRAIGQEMYE